MERDRYSHLLDAVPGGIAVFDIHRGAKVGLIYFNDEICKLTGYDSLEVAERGAYGVCQAIEADLERVNQQATEALRAGSSVILEFRTRKKTGELIYLRTRMAVEETSEQTLTAYVVYTDITMQKRAEQEISKEYSYLAAVEDSNLLRKCRANVTRNLIDNYTASEKMSITSMDSDYEHAVEHVCKCCVTQ